MTAPLPLSLDAMPREARRLMIGLALSIAVHLALMLGFSPSRPHYLPPIPLQVEIRREAAPEPATELAVEQPPSDLSAPAAAVTPPPEPVSHETGPPAPLTPKAPIELGLLDKYFTAQEVDVRAEPINEVYLVYPKRAYEMRLRGSVVVRIFINQHGAIDSISILEATPPGFFEEAALTATQALQFRPAQKYGRDVKSQKTIEVVFDPYERINIP